MTRSAAVALKDEAHKAQEMLTGRQIHEWDKINAIERPWTPDIDPIPERWTIEHLQRRLVEAMRTLSKLPGVRGPREPGGHWPKHSYEWGDRLGWEELPDDEKRARDARQNYVTDRPSAKDTYHMELCIGWLTDFRKTDQNLGDLISEWAAWKAVDRHVTDLCEKRGAATASFYRSLRQATKILVDKLNDKPVPVF